MWYSAGENIWLWEIGYATSADGINWEKHPEPVLKVGPDETDITEKHTRPAEYKLNQNYPNPFNPGTTIEYTIGAYGYSPTYVDLSIYNTLGQKISTLVSEKQSPGKYRVKWNAHGLPSGVYMYKLETEHGYRQVKKLVLLK
jgi:hypothetical protein